MAEREQQQPEPISGRPRMPSSYGIESAPSTDMISWQSVEERLLNSHNYWVVTSSPKGRPHAVPVWGIWLEGSFYFATDRASRKGRNLAANPRILMHLESGDDVISLDGSVEETNDASVLGRFADTYEAKYPFRPDASNAENAVYRLRPRVVLAWREQDFPKSATRWSFSGQ